MSEIFYTVNNTKFAKTDIKIKHQLFDHKTVFITSSKLELDINNIKYQNDVKSIRLTTHDYKLDNLDFLKKYDLKFIKSISILSDYIININGLYELTEIESINSYNVNIDFSKFKKIRSIAGELSNYSYNTITGINQLERLNLEKFKNDDFKLFSLQNLMSRVGLNGSRLLSLKGFETLNNLECVELYYSRRLNSLEGLTSSHKKLKELRIYKAPKLFHVNEFISKLSNLEIIQLDCKKVDSLKFLDKLNNLKFVSIHNKVLDVADGDKDPLIRALKRTNGKIWK